MTTPINLDLAITYDIECLPNVFLLNAIGLHTDVDLLFEISEYRDDRVVLRQWLEYWQAHQVPMIGYNNLSYDYPVLHRLWLDPHTTFGELYEFSQHIISNFADRFGSMIWADDRLAPQIDLFKIMHFDNRAKSTSLKALQVNMRSDSVVEMPLPFDRPLSRDQIDTVLIPYNKHDTRETRKFAKIIYDAMRYRVSLMDTLHGDVINFNDGKIGRAIIQQRLGDDLCYERDDGGRRSPRQTFRSAIPLAEIIFPYISFRHPEFQRVLSWMRTQTLTADELKADDEGRADITTKGVFQGVHATVAGLDYHFGTGGIHGSVATGVFASDANYAIVDIDVAGMYPNIAIVNRLYPKHLGEKFVEVYAGIPKERAQYKKGTKENSTLKLAGNVPYGDSKNVYSFLYDPKFTMTITINGQLMLCMLAEWLLDVWSLQILQINTDGITYRCHRSVLEHARTVQRMWERATNLVLESAEYRRMWIRDVNSYVAEDTKGKLKQKGAYWFANVFPDDISNSSPPAWHKDFSAVVCTKAAVANMVHGKDVARFIYEHREPFDFMCRAKVDRSSHLYIGETEVQRITRYYVANTGGHMRKISPPPKGARVGDYKRRSGLSDHEWESVSATVPAGIHDPRIHTKNKSRHAIRETSIESGYEVAECNRASDFDFANVNYQWYIEHANKLVVK